MNNQEPLHPYLDGDGKLFVHSWFLTIQGEGPFAGRPAVFVRLAGCNLSCPMCDTEYTAGAVEMDPDLIVAHVKSFQFPRLARKMVVLTGGEPFRQNIVPLVRKLTEEGYRVQIETNGTLYMPGPWNDPDTYIVVSPKTSKLNERLVSFASAFKYVASDEDISTVDGLPTSVLGSWHAGSIVARPPSRFDGANIYLQPMDAKDPIRNKKNIDAVVASCLKHGYKLCLQLHKIVGVE